MMHCDECHLDYIGELDRCPLCSRKLVGIPAPSVFPENKLEAPKKVVQRCLIALALAGLCAIIAIGWLVHAAPLAIGAGIAAVLVTYIFIRNVVVHSPNFLRMVERYFLVLIALALLYLLATGDDNAATYVIPLISLTALIINAILVVAFRNGFVQGYAKYLLYELALGLVPLALLIAGLVTWPVPAIATTIAAGILLILMLTLARKQLATELHKLFHT